MRGALSLSPSITCPMGCATSRVWMRGAAQPFFSTIEEEHHVASESNA
jgi:hypothetical protein